MSGPEAHEVVLAVWEACANAIEHAVDPREDMLQLWVELTDTGLRIAIEDTGAWAPRVERSNRGFGLRLMQAAMTSVEIDPASTGTRVILEKSLAGPGEPPG